MFYFSLFLSLQLDDFLLCFLSVCVFHTRKVSHMKGTPIALIYNNSLTATVFKVILAKYSHTFIFIASNKDSAENLASYFRADEVFTDLKWVIPPRARGSKLAIYHFHPPCFHYLSMVVFTPQ